MTDAGAETADATGNPDPAAEGYSNREIGQLLGLAERTVKNHTSIILAKLRARDRTRAVLKAIELGYLP